MRRLLSSIGRVLCLPLAVMGCAEISGDAQQRSPRPGIEATELRCGPVEVMPIGRAERLVPLPNGEIYLVGNSYNRFRQAAGQIVQFDPTGAQRPLVHSLGWPVMALTLTDRGLVTAMDRANFFRWSAEDFDSPEQVASIGGIQELTAVDLIKLEGGHLASGTVSIAEGDDVPAMIRVDPETHELVWYKPYVNNQGLPIIRGHYTSIAAGQRGEIVAVGTGRDVEDGTTRYGFYTRLSTRDGFTLARRQFDQIEFEPMRLVHNRGGEPVVLAVEGHQGTRYENAQPFMARFDDDGALVDKRKIALPDGATQGALLAAWPLPDGEWLLGGSACGEARAWCQAWVLRVDRDGGIIWSRTVARDVAATVNDVHVTGNRVFAAMSSSYYCCEFDELDYDAWLWELDLDGNCPLSPGLKRDGAVFR